MTSAEGSQDRVTEPEAGWSRANGDGAAAKRDLLKVGRRLRELRQAQAMTQRDLARRAGLTNGTVSLIELGRMSPSVASLKKLLDALGTNFVEFFAELLPGDHTVFFAPEELTVLVEGELRFWRVGGGGAGCKLQILYEEYDPGADTGEEMLQHGGEEGGMVLQGRVEVTVGDQIRVLGPRESYFFSSRIPHRFRNVGTETAIIISACTPPSL